MPSLLAMNRQKDCWIHNCMCVLDTAGLSVMWYVFTRIDNKYTWPTGRQHIHRNARSLKAEHPRSTGDPHSVVLVVCLSGTPPNS